METNCTWKWILTIERIEHGIAEKCKAKFVANGFAQTESAYFGGIFAPTNRPERLG